MPCTNPGTLSPGKLVWFYSVGAALRQASMSFNFNNTVDITDVATIQVEADRLANLIKPCVTNKVHLIDWGIKLYGGHVYYRAPLTTGAGAGTHALVAPDYFYSQTIAFVGHGIPLGPGGCSGPITARLHVCGSLAFTAGETIMGPGVDAAVDALTAGINASVFVAADYYGRGGDVSANHPVQFNAAIQKKWGT